MPYTAPGTTAAEGNHAYIAKQRAAEPARKEIHRWGVILAGGEGLRLRSLTRLISGDERPKQFCRLFGGKTLLAHTRERIAKNITPDHILYLLAKPHEPFYAPELSKVPSRQMIVQPCNRGTLPAIVYGLTRVLRLDERAVVAFLPSDHYYANEDGFREGLALALEVAEFKRNVIILLGVRARSPEVEYGWIEPTNVVPLDRANPSLFDVRRFWEKPSINEARALWVRGCLWNTFTMVGSAKAFLRLLETTAAEVCRPFARMSADKEAETKELQTIYEMLPCSDFSREVLSKSANRLSVLSLGDVGWSDFGDPTRVVAALGRHPKVELTASTVSLA
jgi:mannose-1-phosphate guanylyltransferase